MVRTKFVGAGGWKTVDAGWNFKATFFFKAPANADIRVLYGGRFGVVRQTQTLDGNTYKRLVVGWGSLVYAEAQIKVRNDTNVTYDIHPGGVAVSSPSINF
jgi:hypothetical protein